MSGVKCQWVSFMLSKPPAESLLEHEKNAIDTHLQQCDHCSQLKELAQQLNQCKNIDPPPLSPFTEKKIISAALEGRMPNQPKVNWVPQQRVVAITIGIAAAVLTGVALMWFTASANTTKDHPQNKVASSHIDKTPTVSVPAKNYNLFTFKNAEPMTLMREDKVWGEHNTIVNLEMLSANLTQMELIQGKIVVKVSKRNSGEKFVITSPQAIVEVVGTVFSVTVDTSGEEHIRVIEGVVKVTDTKTGAVQNIAENSQFTLGSVGPTLAASAEVKEDIALMTTPMSVESKDVDATPSTSVGKGAKSTITLARKAIEEKRLGEASEYIERVQNNSGQVQNVPSLLARLARAYRQQKNYSAAQHTYNRLINEYSESDAARNSIVALAQLELNVLNKKQSALNHFNNYLKTAPSGYLSEEAWIGRARALHSLGQHNELLTTANAYLNNPTRNTFQAEMLMFRANMMLQNGKCSLAQKDYQTIIEKWPHSKKAKQAQKGVSACSGAQ